MHGLRVQYRQSGEEKAYNRKRIHALSSALQAPLSIAQLGPAVSRYFILKPVSVFSRWAIWQPAQFAPMALASAEA